MSDSEESEYEFEYSDESEEGEEDDVTVEIENSFVEGEDCVNSGREEVAKGFFRRVVELENPQGSFSIQAYKYLVLLSLKSREFSSALEDYDRLLGLTGSVTKSLFEQQINDVLDVVGSQGDDRDFLVELYERTLSVLRQSKNERLLFTTMLQRAKLYLSIRDFPNLMKQFKDLHRSCDDSTGRLNERKDTYLLEVYALEIQFYTLQKNQKKLAEIYSLSTRVHGAIPHPSIWGVIRECGGKMHMYRKEWDAAFSDFFEAFKSYDDAGDRRRINCLKYLVLASLLGSSQINPFDSQEARSYRDDPEVTAMTSLVNAYELEDAIRFEKILQSNPESFFGDEFIREFLEDLLTSIRSKVIINMIRPYSRIKICRISEELNIPVIEVEKLLTTLILDGKIEGKIDQVQGIFLVDIASEETRKYKAIRSWTSYLRSSLNALNSIKRD